MDVGLTAELRSAAEFYAVFRDGDQGELWGGKSLLIHALMNKNLDARYELATFLLDRGVVIQPVAAGRSTELHILFGHVSHDLAKDLELARRLIECGVDINAVGERHEVAFQWVLNLKYSDEDLAPIYDLWFAQPVLDFVTKNKAGLSPIELADKVPYRAGIAARMKEYVNEHA
jgi:uncharacterized protein